METLEKGSKGYAVKTLQYYLNMIEDGIFGKLTEEAVKTFQKEHNLTADGIVGPKTWEVLTGATSARKIDKIIVHCTATPEGKDYTVVDITSWHRQKGWNTIGYHWLIYRDGTIAKGREEKKVGAHCEGQNAHSIGVCYVGGCAKDGKTPKDTRTDAQKASLKKKIQELMRQYRLTEKDVYCHNDFNKGKACPSFSHAELIKSVK